MDQSTTPTGMPTADRSVKGPKALFWYLALFFTLGVTAFNTGNLWFQYINKWFPKEVVGGFVRGSFNQSSLKFAIASLIVGTPLFMLFSLFVRKSLKKGSLDSHNKIRTWVTYIILFITLATAIGDLIATIFTVLDGDYTVRFLLKSLTILVIVGWIFAYYGLELRSPNALVSSKIPYLMAAISVAIIGVSIVGSFFFIDSPKTTRAKAYDSTRISNLVDLSYTIDSYYQREEKLPEGLKDLPITDRQYADPQTGEPYRYEILDEDEYKLCATFETSNRDEENEYPYYREGFNFLHDAGEACFSLKISDEFKPRPLPLPAKVD